MTLAVKVALNPNTTNQQDSCIVSVRLLEDSVDIQFIVIVYDERLAVSNPAIVKTENKTMILWGDKPSYSLKVLVLIKLYPITRQQNFRLVQIETNFRRHFKVHIKW